MNSNLYLKVLCQSDYLQSICLFLGITSIVKSIPRISTFHYNFINSICQSKLVDTCIKNEFGNVLKSLKIKLLYSTTDTQTVTHQLCNFFATLDDFNFFVKKSINSNNENDTDTEGGTSANHCLARSKKGKNSQSQMCCDLHSAFALNNYRVIKYWLHRVFKSIVQNIIQVTVQAKKQDAMHFDITIKCKSPQYRFNSHSITATTNVSISSDILDNKLDGSIENCNYNSSTGSCNINENNDADCKSNSNIDIVTITIEYNSDNLSDNVFDDICQWFTLLVTKCNKNSNHKILTKLVTKFQKMFVSVRPVNTFDQMMLKDKLLRGIYSYGFEKASIQSRAIMTIMNSLVKFIFFFSIFFLIVLGRLLTIVHNPFFSDVVFLFFHP